MTIKSTPAQLQLLTPSPPYVELAAQGSTLRLIGKLELSPEVLGRCYPGTFYVSPELAGEIIFGRSWLWKHNVIHEHRRDCIYIGEHDRQRIYLNPSVKRVKNKVPYPEVQCSLPPHLLDEFEILFKRHSGIFYQGQQLKQTIAAINYEIHVSDTRTFRDAPRRYSEKKRG